MFARFKQPQPPAQRRHRPNTNSPQQSKKHAVLIQRLIILHDGLMPLPDNDEEVDSRVPTPTKRRNPQAILSEDASLEEHGEFILYYYNHSIHSVRGEDEEAEHTLKRSGSGSSAFSDAEKENHCTEEAVKFAGLCRALRSLPLALRPQNQGDNDPGSDGLDETEVVYLTDSTLVFVPLELNGDVVAVVQIPRTSNQQTKPKHRQRQTKQCSRQSCVGYGADPTAIGVAVKRCHMMFSLLCGGGIHLRLLRTKYLEKADDWCIEERGSSSDITETKVNKLSMSYSGAAYCYGGMKELFELRRKDRKLNRSNEENHLMGRLSWRRKSNPLSTFGDIADQIDRAVVQDQIESILQLLPITPLRKDIKMHYDKWLANMQGMCAIIKGGVGRSIVELVPAPINEHTLRGQHPPDAPAPFISLAASEFMRSLLAENECTKSNAFQLHGLSIFYQNKYVLSEFTQKNVNIPPEVLCMIFEYVHSNQRNATKPTCKDHKTLSNISTNSCKNTHNAIDRWLSTISAGSQRGDSSSGYSTPANDVAMNGHSTNKISGFSSPPFSPADREVESPESLFIQSLKHEVWLPSLHIQQLLDAPEDECDVNLPVALFAQGDFSFLLFFKGQIDNNASDSELLSELATELSSFCDEHSSTEYDSELVSSMFSGEPGMDIVFVNRNDNTFLLLSQHDLSSNNFRRKINTTSPNNRNNTATGIFGLGFKAKENVDRKNDAAFSNKSSSHIDMLDCRHKLAAYLPLDVMLAFDDMFNEMRYRRRRSSARSPQLDVKSIALKTVELCTYLPQGWVYGRASGECELYVLLDTSKFVTISDVTKAVTKVRERMLNGKL